MDRPFFRDRTGDWGAVLNALAVHYSTTPAVIAEQTWSELGRWCDWAGLAAAPADANPTD